jgi:ribosomal-protein-alanine N-acetyltransferase
MKIPIAERMETERLVLTRFRPEDAEAIFYTYASKPEATRFMMWPMHQSISDTRSYLNYALQGWHQGIDYSFAVRLKSSNRLIGSCGLMNDEGKIQFGYILGPAHWNNGYATETTRALLAEVRRHPEVYRINTFADTENTASIHVLKKCGLEEEVVLEKWFRFPNQNNQPKDCVLFKLPIDVRRKI